MSVSNYPVLLLVSFIWSGCFYTSRLKTITTFSMTYLLSKSLLPRPSYLVDICVLWARGPELTTPDKEGHETFRPEVQPHLLLRIPWSLTGTIRDGHGHFLREYASGVVNVLDTVGSRPFPCYTKYGGPSTILSDWVDYDGPWCHPLKS